MKDKSRDQACVMIKEEVNVDLIGKRTRNSDQPYDRRRSRRRNARTNEPLEKEAAAEYGDQLD